jgi:hypothetical protein
MKRKDVSRLAAKIAEVPEQGFSVGYGKRLTKQFELGDEPFSHRANHSALGGRRLWIQIRQPLSGRRIELGDHHSHHFAGHWNQRAKCDWHLEDARELGGDPVEDRFGIGVEELQFPRDYPVSQ